MSKRFLSFVILSLIFSLPAHAASEAGGVWYGGVKAGAMYATGPLDTAWNAGFLVGRELRLFKHGSLALESEGTFTVSSGDANAFGEDGDWKLQTANLWLAYRGNRTVYPVAKLGLEYTRFSLERPFWRDSASETGLGLSLGIGARLSNEWSLEVEYSPKARIRFTDIREESSIRFLSAGVIYRF